MGTGGRRAMGALVPGSLLTVDNLVKMANAAELVVGLLHLHGVELTDAQKLQLQENHAKYQRAIAESKASEQTGRTAPEPGEGDTD